MGVKLFRVQVSITIDNGNYGLRAIPDSKWSEDLTAYVRDKGVVELELNVAKGWNGDDISFLSALPNLKAFEIFDFGIDSVKPIHHLHALKKLGVTTYCSTEIDFGAFPELENCTLEWRPKATSLFERITLSKLLVNRYKGKDIGPFGKLVNLEALAILNAPVHNLEGLRGLSRLRFLRLANLPRLTSLAGVEGLSRLEALEVHTCRQIHSIKEIGSLTNLRTLYLNNDGGIESLKPLDSLTALESVGFYESTDIIDGDLSPLMRLKKLSKLFFQNRRHYSHRREDFSAYSG
jgi:Leucine-rich repeat (LRR) protein